MRVCPYNSKGMRVWAVQVWLGLWLGFFGFGAAPALAGGGEGGLDARQQVLLTFADAQERLFTHNYTLQRAYEGLYQAHNRIGAARSKFLPNPELFVFAGLAGPTGALVIGGLFVGVHLIALPPAIFEYQANKRLAVAEQYYLEATIRNMQEHVGRLYFQILADQTIYAAVAKKCALNQDLLTYHQQLNEVGAGSELFIKASRAEHLECEKELIAIGSLVRSEVSELKVMLGFNESVDLLLARVEDDDLGPVNIDLGAQADYLGEVDQAPELVLLKHVRSAAKKIRKGEKLSFFSFRGFGLGHSQRVNLAESKLREVELERKHTRLAMVNQIASTYGHLEAQQATNRLLQETLQEKRSEVRIMQDAYEQRSVEFEALCRKKMELIKAETNVLLAKYSTKLLLAMFARQVGYAYDGGFALGPKLADGAAPRDFQPDFRYYLRPAEEGEAPSLSLYLANPLLEVVRLASVKYSSADGKKTMVGDNFHGYRYHLDGDDEVETVKVVILTRGGQKIRGKVTLRRVIGEGEHEARFERVRKFF